MEQVFPVTLIILTIGVWSVVSGQSNESFSINGTLETPSANNTLDTLSTNGTLDTPNANGTLDTPSANGTLDTPSTNGTLDTLSTNGTLETPSANDTLDTPSANGTLDTPSTNGTLDTPSTNGTLDTPSTNGTLDTQSTNGTLDTPDTNGTFNTPTTTTETPEPPSTIEEDKPDAEDAEESSDLERYHLINVTTNGNESLDIDYEEAEESSDFRYTLVADLFKNYNLEVRPSFWSEQTYVFVEVSLLSIEDLNAIDQSLESVIVLDFVWDDIFLMWDESKYGNITKIMYHQEKVWLPDVVIENSVDSQHRLGYDYNKVVITSAGQVSWKVREIVRTGCSIDVTYYPFDSQSCDIIISTWMSTDEEIFVLLEKEGNEGIHMDQYSESGAWVIVDTSVQSLSSKNIKSGEKLTRVKFTFNLRRRKTYYILNLILPLLFLSLTASMVFFIPVESGEKIGLSITVLLAYAVYLTLVSSEIPKTSLQVPIIEVYLNALLGLTAFSVVLTVTVLNLYFRPDEEEIGRRTKAATRILRQILSPKTCSKPKLKLKQPAPKDEADMQVETISYVSPSGRFNNNGVSAEQIYVEEQEEITWKKVAETMDKCCFIVVTFLVVCVTAVFLAMIGIGDRGMMIESVSESSSAVIDDGDN